MKIDEIMHSPVITIQPDTSIQAASQLMRQHNIGFLPVVTEHQIIGVITDRDLVIRALAIDDVNIPVTQVMTPNPMTVASGTEVMTVAKLMAQSNIRRTVVTKNGQAIGVVTTKELLRQGGTLPYVLKTYQVDPTSPYFKEYANGNPHDSVKVDDFPL